MSLLIDVPSDVIVEILSQWLKCSDLIKIYDALYSDVSRSIYLQLLSKGIFCENSQSFNKWLLSKNIIPQSLCISLWPFDDQPHFDHSLNVNVKSLSLGCISKFIIW